MVPFFGLVRGSVKVAVVFFLVRRFAIQVSVGACTLALAHPLTFSPSTTLLATCSPLSCVAALVPVLLVIVSLRALLILVLAIRLVLLLAIGLAGMCSLVAAALDHGETGKGVM